MDDLGFASRQLRKSSGFQISPPNPLLLGATAIALAVARLLVCLLPTRRALQVDPIVALRTE